jgi:E3 ubiquitin-protein ligase UBR1
LLSERSLSLGQDLVTTGRREIIHQLALHPDGVGFSELAKSMSERVVKMKGCETSFEELLVSVATLRMPAGLKSFGVYELKPEFYASVDPYFWHYTRAGREKVWKSKAVEGNLWEFESSGCELPRIDPYPNDVSANVNNV